MFLSEEHAEKLILNIKNANVVHLVEEEELQFDVKGNFTGRKFKEHPEVRFKIDSNSFSDLYKNFKKEFKSNDLTIGFNKQLYCNKIIDQCNVIKSKINRINTKDIYVCIRNDAVFNQYKIGEFETIMSFLNT